MKAESVEESPGEVAGGKAESPLEVGEEDNTLAGLDDRGEFVARDPACYSFRDSPCPGQPINVGLADIGPFPGTSGGPVRDRLGGGGGFARRHWSSA